MDGQTEKEILYALMKSLIDERRDITKAYFEIKHQLDDLIRKESERKKQYFNKTEQPETIPVRESSKFEREITHQKDVVYKQQKFNPCHFERLSGYIVELLKNSSVPLSNKEIYTTLITKHELAVKESNISSNILPRMHKTKSIPVMRAYRGYWQYQKIE